MQKQTIPTKILVAPLNWGWGHAARCIPIIKEIQRLGLLPVIASDGDALNFLQKEFPDVEVLKLPSYHITYGDCFKWSMFLNGPSILKGMYREHQTIKKYVTIHKESLLGMISDNRLGVFANDVRSIYITHQLNIKAGKLSLLLNSFHRFYIKKHKECWVPDEVGSVFSGDLSVSKKMQPVYIGVLSRFKKQETPIVYDVLVLLSGIEYQRNQLEKAIVEELNAFKGSVLLVRGTFKPSKYVYSKNVTVVDYLLSKELGKAINSAKAIIVRSGYSSVMDMAVLEKKVLYIPTPGQTEQEYLATYLKNKNLGVFCSQKLFSIKELERLKSVTPVRVDSSSQKLQDHLKRFFTPFQV